MPCRGLEIRKVEALVQGGYRFAGEVPDHRKMQDIDMKMKHIEFARALPNFLEHQNLMRNRILHRGI
jgi:hypothetical protein